MIYQILKETEYKGCPVYIRRLDKHFESLILYNNKLYSQYITLVPKWHDAFKADPFSTKDVQNVVAVLLGKARKSIDLLKKPK